MLKIIVLTLIRNFYNLLKYFWKEEDFYTTWRSCKAYGQLYYIDWQQNLFRTMHQQSLPNHSPPKRDVILSRLLPYYRYSAYLAPFRYSAISVPHPLFPEKHYFCEKLAKKKRISKGMIDCTMHCDIEKAFTCLFGMVNLYIILV